MPTDLVGSKPLDICNLRLPPHYNNALKDINGI